MAIFLSRLKQILNLGTKSITSNGTYNASSDGYDGYSQVSVNMPSVTPNNASPAALTDNSPVTPSANGYAIVSYSSITPSSTPTQVINNQIVKVGGTGIIIDDIPVPPSITPSNGNPAQLYGNTAVTPTRNGYAIESYTNITPDNTNPPNLLSGGIYKNEANFRGYAVKSFTNMTPKNNPPQSFGADTVVHFDTAGYAIASYENKTPSDSSPASVSSGEIIKASSSGYLYASSGLKKVKTGTFTMSSTSGTVDTVTLGFQPKYICMYNNPTGTPTLMSVYDENFSTTKWIRVSSTGITVPNIGNSQNFNINSITSTGFTTKAYNGATVRYFAIG